MADRISQIQALIQDQSHFMTNAIGVLVLQAPACDFNSTCEELIKEDQAEICANCIAKAAGQIEQLIDSLPVDEIRTEDQNQKLSEMNDRRSNAARELEAVCKEGEDLVIQLQARLAHISKVQLESRPRI